MMDILVLMIGFHLLSISLCPVGAVLSENRREDLIQDSVRKLLGVQSTPKEARKTPLPPSYVMDLYEKYRSGRTPMQGNTVRSILPMRDTIGDADVLIFNLTGINPSEQILQSKLYLLKRRRRPKAGKKRESNSHFRIKIGSLPHMTSHRYVEVSLTRHRSEWHSYDITESVVHCRQNTNNDQLLGVTLEVRRARGSYRLSPFRRLLKQDSQPFVLIFSEDSGNLTKGTSLRGSEAQGEIQGLLRAKTGAASVLQRDSSEKGLLDRRKRFLNGQDSVQKGFDPSDFPDYKMYSVYKHLKNNAQLFGDGTLTSRLEKLALLNEFISSFSNDPHSAWEGFDRSKLFSRAGGLQISSSRDNPEKVLDYYKLSRWRDNSSISDLEVVPALRSKRSVSGTASKELTESASEAFQNSLGDHKPTNSSDWPGLKKRKKNRGDGSRRRKKKKKKKPGRKNNPKLPFWWTRHDSRFHTQDLGRLCQRKKLVVDFVQLGWGDWVISPKTFNAHYCSGGCSFPMIRNANPSNHAAIQSLMHAIGMAPEVPTPSCVPSVSSPLTLLFFDEHGNLVLKNYPNMIVEKCACR